MQIVVIANFLIWLIFFICYLYQIFYILVPYIKKDRPQGEAQKNRFAVLISARNESHVIKNLIDSINKQTYPRELIDVYVVADNCTDNTADIARELGANVYNRFDNVNIGKGYALNFLLGKIKNKHGNDYYDGYFVFDADNVLDNRYIEEMNKTLSSGYKIITSYRNSKNYGDNWISAGYGLWFLRESKYLNYARMLMDTSCAISGTGFLFDKEIAKKLNGWNYYLLTEDIEFTVDHVINEHKIGYCNKAVLYDEQPNTFGQSVRQRMRWAKGYFQVLCNYGPRLVKGIFGKNKFSCYDMSMSIMPALILTIFCTVINITAVVTGLAIGISVLPVVKSVISGILGMYLMMYIIGFITTISEWKKIYTNTFKKILYMFTFPIFMMTYIPITIVALFKKVEWKPIVHSESKTLDDIKSSAG
ncbi:MAG: glycosyltransferase family 2 protein [Oscillospiraceae bacterium]|nr:glycosyltransferase family 2 protein [Oscillospiraceae bacterium]